MTAILRLAKSLRASIFFCLLLNVEVFHHEHRDARPEAASAAEFGSGVEGGRKSRRDGVLCAPFRANARSAPLLSS